MGTGWDGLVAGTAMRARHAETPPWRRLVALALVVGGAGCSRSGGIVGGAIGPQAAVPPSTTIPGPPPESVPSAPSSSEVPATSVASTSAPPTSAQPTPSPPTAPGTLRLGGDDLGVTKVGSPFRDAVAAVSATLGRPTADPPPDSACIGAETETIWGDFRLAGNGGRVSGWRSTSTTLATPAGAKAGTTVAALRQAYGAALQIRPAPEPEALPGFVVSNPRLGGSLTGTAPTDTVRSIFNGTCEEA